MGFSFKRILRNPVSLISPLAGGFSELDPGPNGNDPRAPGYYAGSPDSVQWDPNTNMPILPPGTIPGSEFGLQFQYEAQRRTQQQRNALWGSAQGTIGQGLDLLQSYRPGGSAALASGLFGQRANLFAGQAASLEEPDLMSAYREKKEIEATREAKKAARMQAITGVLGALGGVAGAAMGAPGGGAGATTAAGIGNPQGVGSALSGGQGSLYGPQTAQAGMAPNGPAMAPQMGPQMGPQSFQGFQAPNPNAGTAQAGMAPSGPGGSAGGQQAGFALGAGGSGGAGGPVTGGPQPGRPSPSQPGGGMAAAGGGGLGQGGILAGPALVQHTVASDPMTQQAVINSLAGSRYYSDSTMFRLSSSVQLLQAAMAI